MSRSAEEVLEFDKLRELLRQRTTCVLGRRAIDALEFSLDAGFLGQQFALVREAREWLRSGRDLGFGSLADPAPWLAKVEGPGAALEPGEFLEAASLLETAAWLRVQFREEAAQFPLLAEQSAAVADFREVLAAIRRCVLPNGEISDDASPALRRIRASMVETRDGIQRALKQILRLRNAEAGEDYVTLRNDRFVIPVRAENRRSVPGLVHGASSTGQTVFLEPFETVEANNQLVELAEDESAEILRILRELTARLERELPALWGAARTVQLLDGVFSRGRFAREFDAALPEFSSEGVLQLESARHPVLEDKLKRERRVIVPMTLGLNRDERLLVVSGPNTGGKTVALKTAGLAALAAQCAIPVAAQARGAAVVRPRAGRYRRRAVHRRRFVHFFSAHAEPEGDFGRRYSAIAGFAGRNGNRNRSRRGSGARRCAARGIPQGRMHGSGHHPPRPPEVLRGDRAGGGECRRRI
jgi:DNA mismatch repair protein MutS2